MLLDAVTGVLTGSPSVGGDFQLTVHVVDASKSEVTHTYSLRVEGGVVVPTELSATVSNGVLILSLRGGAGATWQVETASEPDGPWTALGDPLVLPADGVGERTQTATLPAAYFRATSR